MFSSSSVLRKATSNLLWSNASRYLYMNQSPHNSLLHTRHFSEIKPEATPGKTKEKVVTIEETGGYYKEFVKNKDDPYYDPYHPYIWIQKFPRSLQPILRFMRVDQNFGRMLASNPHYWGLSIASTLIGFPDLFNMAIFYMGVCFAHGAGCCINDMIDAPVDIKNVRTQRRPLPSGVLKKSTAAIITSVLLGASFTTLSMLSPLAIKVGLLMTPAVVLYPYMKRIFTHPQVFLGLLLNMGCFMGFAAVANCFVWPILIPLFFAGMTQTVFYDSIYAFQDIEMDKKSGIQSTSQQILKHAKLISGLLAGTSFSLHVLTGFIAGLHPAFMGIMAIGGAHLAWMTWKLNPKDAPLCDHMLNIAYRYGTLVFLAYCLGVWMKSSKGKKKKEKKAIKDKE